VLVRFSGTEPLARVMVEGPDQERVEDFAQRIASQIEVELG
jgi:phosphoglucosamine mutase